MLQSYSYLKKCIYKQKQGEIFSPKLSWKVYIAIGNMVFIPYRCYKYIEHNKYGLDVLKTTMKWIWVIK
jgi:hypothetical protein